MTAPSHGVVSYDSHNADDMLRLIRVQQEVWRRSKSRSAAARHASVLIIWAAGRIDCLAADGQLPAEWVARSVLHRPPGG